MIAKTPKPPYYAVIFTSFRTDIDDDYVETSKRLASLAKKSEGFLGEESAREEMGISISYWKDVESIMKWRMNADHQQAQKLGKEKWYKNYKVRICKVERDYEF